MISLLLDNPVTNSITVLYPLIMHTVHNVDVGYGFTNTRGLTSHYISIKRTQEISNFCLRMPILCLHCTLHPVNFKGSCFKEIFTIIFVSKLRLLITAAKQSLLIAILKKTALLKCSFFFFFPPANSVQGRFISQEERCILRAIIKVTRMFLFSQRYLTLW